MSIQYNQSLVDRTGTYVTRLYINNQPATLFYHDLVHTQKVVDRAYEIAKNHSLSETELFILIAAAWFHDCGHLSGPAHGHEERSVAAMKKFLAPVNVERDILQLIEQCICSTIFPYQPGNLVSEILCDADSYHLGTDEFLLTDPLVKKEFELRNGFIPVDWDQMTLTMLETHHFFTSYCHSLLDKGKEQNIEFLRTKIEGKIE